MATIDTYNDGLAIVLELTRPASAEDIGGARALLSEWLSAYDQAKRGYRNAALQGREGDRTLTLWADRIADPDGHAAAEARARATGQRAKELLPVADVRIESADAVSRADLEARVGAPVFTVRPGGDIVGDLRRSGLLPRPAGLRPNSVWLVVVLFARFIGKLFEAPMTTIVGSGIVIAGVITLSMASRAYLRSSDHVLAAGTVLAAGAHIAVAVLMPGSQGAEAVARLVMFGAGLGWSVQWVKRGR